MTRNQLAAAAAAAFIAGAGGLASWEAWRDANDADADPRTRRQMGRIAEQLDNDRREVFALVALGYNLPEAFDPSDATGERWIGDCQPAQGVCTLGVTRRRSAGYQYRRTAATAGWRLVGLKTSKYFVGSWKKLAATVPASVVFLGRRRDVQTGCAATALTPLQCHNLQTELDPCWRGGNANAGTAHRAGWAYGPGNGGTVDDAPTVAEVDAGDWLWIACSVTAGENAEALAVQAVPPDLELVIGEN